MDRINWRQVFLWVLYDFANSIVVITFFLYFAQWLVVDRGVSDFWFNGILVGGTVLLLAFAPVLGARADRMGKRMPSLRVTTLLAALFYGITGAVAAFAPEYTLLAALAFLLANAIYQLSFAFYNPLLTELGPERRWGTISGIGQATNWLGQIVGLLITLPLANGTIHLFGAAGRAQPLLPAAIIFLVLTLPMLFFFREQTRPALLQSGGSWRSLFKLFAIPGVSIFILSYFLFNDAFLTLTNNLPIYLERVFGVTDTQKAIAFMASLFSSAIGGLLAGRIADWAGAKKTLMVILCAWAVIIPALAFAQSFLAFAIIMGVVGAFFGGTWAVTRMLMAQILPADKMVQGFSLYVLAERTASFAGPLAWGAAVVLLPTTNFMNYRGAMLLMTVFIVAGIAILWRLPRPSVALPRT